MHAASSEGNRDVDDDERKEPNHERIRLLRRATGTISLDSKDLSEGEIFQSLRPFFVTNNNLSALEVKECGFGPGCVRQLSLALGDCNHSLTSVRLSQNYMGDDPDNLMDGAQLAEIIEALGVHPQLGNLELICMNIGTNECMALADLLHSTFTQLEKLEFSYMSRELRELDLNDNDIDDEGIDALVRGLTNSNLRVLGLSGNGITSRGCRSLAAMLEHPNSNLEELYLYDNNIGDERAPILANSLARNCKLKILDLRFSGITAEGWFGFKTVLCDTSSISSTFLSNHTLIGLGFTAYPNPLPDDVEDLLDFNEGNDDKKQVAMEKILMHHPHFDMHPFFEWDMKVLPIMIEWFERAGSFQYIDEVGVSKRKLDVIYQFICAMPMMYIDACTRRELDAISSLKTELQREQLKLLLSISSLFLNLKEVEEREARATRRL